MHNVIIASAPNAFVAPVFSTTSETVEMARDSVMYSVAERMKWEVEHNPIPADLASITKYLNTFKGRVKRADAFTLGFFAANVPDFGAVFLSHRVSNACMNVYALPKCFSVARALNGSALNGDDANDETIAGIVLAMQRGIYNSKSLGYALNDHMNRDGKRVNYSSGATQSSSALRALEALKVVHSTGYEGNAKVWGVANQERFSRLVDAANGTPHTVSTPASVGWDAIDTSVMSEEGNETLPETIDAEAPVLTCDEVEAIIAAEEASASEANAAPAETAPVDDATAKREAYNAKRRAKRAAAKGE